jgi:hypothetical protein
MLVAILLPLAIAAADTTPPPVDSVAPDTAVIVAAAAGPRLTPSPFAETSLASADTVRSRRAHAVEYSDWYARRLAIHRIGSYVMLPLFAGEYALGQRLLSTSPQPDWVRPTHRGVAYGLGALFTVNTVTGAWNLWDSRHDENGRTRRLVHTALMLASDAGFAYTGSIGQQGRSSLDASRRHRNAALASMGLSVAGTGMMWFWKD